MVKYQQRYWIETDAEWTVQEHGSTKKTSMNNTKPKIATRFEVYPKTEHECSASLSIHKTEYNDIYILHEYVFDMITGKEMKKQKANLKMKNLSKKNQNQ